MTTKKSMASKFLEDIIKENTLERKPSPADQRKTKNVFDSFVLWMENCLNMQAKDLDNKTKVELVSELKACNINLTNLLTKVQSHKIAVGFQSFFETTRQSITVLLDRGQKYQSYPYQLERLRLENVKLEKSIKILMRKLNQPVEPIQQRHQHCQTVAVYDKQQLKKDNVVIRTNTINQPKPNLKPEGEMYYNRFNEAYQMLKQDYICMASRYTERIERLNLELDRIKLNQKIIAYRTLMKKNPVQFFCPILKIKNDSASRKSDSRRSTNVSLFLEYNKKIESNLFNNSLDDHPFRVIRTIRAILDSLQTDFKYEKKFNFGLYVNNWFKNFELNYEITKRVRDMEIDKINFITALKDYNLSKLWDIIIFRQLLDNKYESDQVDFMIRVRYALLKQPQLCVEGGSQIIYLVTFESCKEAFASLFKKYSSTFSKPILQKLSKGQIKIKQEYKVDYAFALKLALDFYKEIRKERYSSFTKFEFGHKFVDYIQYEDFCHLMKRFFESISHFDLDQIFTEISVAQISRLEQIWQYCIFSGYLNNKIIVLNQQYPKIKSTNTFSNCIEEYDKIAPLLSLFRKGLMDHGSIYYIQFDQSLHINGKIGLTDVITLFRYFHNLDRLLNENINEFVLNTIFTHDRDEELEISMLHSMLKSIASKLNIWKKINMIKTLHNDYVISSLRKIQRMVRSRLTNIRIHEELRKKLDDYMV